MEVIYKLFDLRKYYPDFIGSNPIAVVSDLTEEELLLHCPELQHRVPFVYFDREKWSAFRKAQRLYDRNNEKFKKRQRNLEDCYGYQEGRSELNAACLDEEDIMDTVIKKITIEHLHEILVTLPESQHRRILMYYSGYTFAEIAASENVARQVVQRSVKKAMKNILKNF